MGSEKHLPSRPRVERSQGELQAFQKDLEAWRSRRAKLDVDKRHSSQLEAVSSLLRGAASVLDQKLGAVEATLALSPPPGPPEIYEQCLTFDRRIGWMQRLWKYFRDRFDQRDDDRYKALLEAADEVVWSCFQPPMASARARGILQGTRSPPLPFVELELSPAATPATSVPRVLERDGNDEALQAVLKRLPFAGVHLPAASLRSPWWLVFVAHEVGHCVQAELGLVEPFSAHLRSAVRAQTKDPTDLAGELWASWSEEVFADYFSVLMVGTAALRGLIEFELKTPPKMRMRPSSYPPSAVRLALVARLLDALGLDGKGALGDIDPAAIVAGDANAEADLALVPAVVEAVRGDLPGLPAAMPGKRTLESLCQFSDLQATFTIAEPVVPVSAPRRVVKASVARWDEVSRLADATKRAAALSALAQLTLESLRKAHAPGTRAPTASGDATAQGVALGEALLAMSLPGEEG